MPPLATLPLHLQSPSQEGKAASDGKNTVSVSTNSTWEKSGLRADVNTGMITKRRRNYVSTKSRT